MMLPRKFYSACVFLAVAFATSALQAKQPLPEVTHDGLVATSERGHADKVYVLPGLDMTGYKKIILAEPDISFRRSWKRDVNMDRRANRLSDRDVLKTIKLGQKLLTEEFTKELKKGKFPMVGAPAEDVLLIHISITELDIFAPDPSRSNGIWTDVYSEAAGDATLTVELYDSVTGEILVRAIDRKRDIGDQGGWNSARTHSSNIRDARGVLGEWARALVKGLNEATKAVTKD